MRLVHEKLPVEKVTESWSPATTQMPRKSISIRDEVCCAFLNKEGSDCINLYYCYLNTKQHADIQQAD